MDKNFTQQEFRENFSQRNGFTAVPQPLNPGELSDQLRLEFNDLLHREYEEGSWNSRHGGEAADWEKVLAGLWVQKFKRMRMPGMHPLCLQECRQVIQHRE